MPRSRLGSATSRPARQVLVAPTSWAPRHGGRAPAHFVARGPGATSGLIQNTPRRRVDGRSRPRRSRREAARAGRRRQARSQALDPIAPLGAPGGNRTPDPLLRRPIVGPPRTLLVAPERAPRGKAWQSVSLLVRGEAAGEAAGTAPAGELRRGSRLNGFLCRPSGDSRPEGRCPSRAASVKSS